MSRNTAQRAGMACRKGEQKPPRSAMTSLLGLRSSQQCPPALLTPGFTVAPLFKLDTPAESGGSAIPSGRRSGAFGNVSG